MDCSQIALKFIRLQIANRKRHGKKLLNPAYIVSYAEKTNFPIVEIENFFYKFTFEENPLCTDKDYRIALGVVKAQSGNYQKKFLDENYFKNLSLQMNVETELLKDFFNAIFS
ncbi:hypothetical protein IT400_04295 [Candidatus Nomurabacteria bacterium]|nr:hypothetical protein [Candidatus Nomurabacteria bacterium]